MFVSHSNCIELANATIEELEKRFPKLKGKIVLGNIGTTIASHTGVGTVAVFSTAASVRNKQIPQI